MVDQAVQTLPAVVGAWSEDQAVGTMCLQWTGNTELTVGGKTQPKGCVVGTACPSSDISDRTRYIAKCGDVAGGSRGRIASTSTLSGETGRNAAIPRLTRSIHPIGDTMKECCGKNGPEAVDRAVATLSAS